MIHHLPGSPKTGRIESEELGEEAELSLDRPGLEPRPARLEERGRKLAEQRVLFAVEEEAKPGDEILRDAPCGEDAGPPTIGEGG